MVPCSLMIALAFTIVAGVTAVQPFFVRKTENRCACKNWKQAYQSGIECGSGKEWAWEATPIRKPPLQYWVYSYDSTKKLICKNFWEVLDSDRCINLNVGKDEGTWCYVHSSCKTLNGGSEINDQFSWKKCAHDELKFSDYTPQELYNFSQQNDIWFGGLEKISHPGSRVGERQLVNVDDFSYEIPTWVALKLKKFGTSTRPYWFDTNDNGTMPFMIVHDNKVYRVDAGPVQDPQHPRTWSTLNCTLGC